MSPYSITYGRAARFALTFEAERFLPNTLVRGAESWRNLTIAIILSRYSCIGSLGFALFSAYRGHYASSLAGAGTALLATASLYRYTRLFMRKVDA